MLNVDGVRLTPLKHIVVPDGDVFHAMKNCDPGYDGFGEAYFSTIESGSIKAWKRHNTMILNLVVPIGAIRFVVYDDRDNSLTYDKFYEVTLSRKKYSRLTLPPKVWMGFQCMSNETAMLLNIANIPHNPNEKKGIEKIMFDWSLKK
jgi:dTDP-4-dehydrorhamnose 3,5-epimerase